MIRIDELNRAIKENPTLEVVALCDLSNVDEEYAVVELEIYNVSIDNRAIYLGRIIYDEDELIENIMDREEKSEKEAREKAKILLEDVITIHVGGN